MSDNETTTPTPEEQITHLTHETETLRAQLAESQLRHLNEREAERALVAAGAIDVDIAAPLIIAAVAAAKVEERSKAATKAVSELKARKPFLFAASASPRIAGAMAPALRIAPPSQPTREQLAEQARTTGDRGALLRYLKSRRAA